VCDQEEIPEVELSESVVMAAAEEQTGCSDWGKTCVFGPALARYLSALEGEAQLNEQGRFGVWQGVVARLSQRLLLQQQGFDQVSTGIADRPSFVIAGLPRTGSTLLQRLLSLDPDSDSLRFGDVSMPVPATYPGTEEDEAKIEQVGQALDKRYSQVPELRSLHEMDPRLPDEETFLINQSFMSILAPLGAHVPNFWAWVMDSGDHRGTYKELKHLVSFVGQYRTGSRWVLKSPHHLWMQDSLLEEFPNATVIWTHRDPVRLVPSMASLAYALRAPASDHATREQAGRDWLDMLSDGLTRGMSARRAAENRFIDVHYQDLMHDPQAAVAAIYTAADLDMPEAMNEAIRTFLADNPKGKHGSHRYTAEQFGLSEGEIIEVFLDYIRTYDVVAEA
jgi:hypothetical protein